ncbi:MAG: PH domain-containing protein [Candidatus Nomurabacteria bacterium]|jgi:hypothetical protein|nr:PH domain-containing protein [Candidatus Nomurabacteria bacterium]
MAQAFSGQRQGEKVLFLFRRHVLTARKGLYSLLICMVIGMVPPLIWSSDSRVFLVPVAGLLVGLVLAAYHYTLWYFTIYIVTSERIRQVSQKGFFRKSVVDLDLMQIQSLNYSVPGVFASVFDYGTIVIQTIVGDLVISNVAHPEKIYNKLHNAYEYVIRQARKNDKG